MHCDGGHSSRQLYGINLRMFYSIRVTDYRPVAVTEGLGHRSKRVLASKGKKVKERIRYFQKHNKVSNI